jgi:iron complex outermembrane receptor protein
LGPTAGAAYNDDGSVHSAVAIDPFNITNLFINCTLRNASAFAQSRIRFSVNNLFDSHAIVGVSPASTRSSLAAPGDVLTLMAARSVSLTLTVGFSPQP